jgi:Mg-chelatase subunit ChlD
MLTTDATGAYYVPNDNRLAQVAKQANLSRFEPWLIRDAAKVAAGIELKPLNELSEELGPALNKGMQQMYDTLRAAAPSLQKHEHVSPANRAAAFLKFLQNKSEEQEQHRDRQENPNGSTIPGGDGGLKQSVFMNPPGQTAVEYEEYLDQLSNMNKHQREMLGLDEESGPIDAAMKSGCDEKIWINISQKLKTKSRFTVRQTLDFTRDPQGSDRRVSKMREPSQLASALPAFWALPKMHQHIRAAEKNVMVRERVSRIDRKLFVYVIVDASGSMTEYNRIAKQAGIVMNRCQAVTEGLAEMYLRRFEVGLIGDEYHIHDKESAEHAMELAKSGALNNGGGTGIQTAMDEAVERIRELSTEHHCHPELIVISDGDDGGVEHMDYGGIRVHMFMVDGQRDELLAMARRTGGVGLSL